MAAEKLEDMVPLPVDVNGEVIHIGDEMVTSMGVRNVVDYIDIRLREKDTYHYISFKDSRYRYDPRELRHYLVWRSGTGNGRVGGITPLVNSDGSPVIAEKVTR